MALSPLSFEYNFEADTTSEPDFNIESTLEHNLSKDKFWEFCVYKWHHHAYSGSTTEFDDDHLSIYHSVFQIIAFLELVIIVLHFRYRHGGWRPQRF